MNEAFRLGGFGSQTFVTRRGHLLVVTTRPVSDLAPVAVPLPVLTVELAPKWYTLHAVHRGETVVPIPFDALGPGGWVDHVPNPEAVERFANEHNYEVDDVAMDLIVGRWQREVKS
jgi:hypothetical protein